MQINVSQQLKEPIGATRSYEIDEAITISVGNSTVQGEVKLLRTDLGILVQGTLQTKVEFDCSRCLSPFDCSLTLNIEEEYAPTTDVISDAPISLPKESSCFTIDDHNILDLDEAIRQYLLLALPMKPLCGKDCAGLCPSCSHNLNYRSCNCPSQHVDPRWYKLSKLA